MGIVTLKIPLSKNDLHLNASNGVPETNMEQCHEGSCDARETNRAKDCISVNQESFSDESDTPKATHSLAQKSSHIGTPSAADRSPQSPDSDSGFISSTSDSTHWGCAKYPKKAPR